MIKSKTKIVQDSLNHLKGVKILPRRLLLSTPGVEASVPMIRGTWGSALHSLDPVVYSRVFSPPEGQSPLYVLRNGPDNPRENPCLDYLLFNEAVDDDRQLMRAWGKACRTGLGPNRLTFFINGYTLDSSGSESLADEPWNLSESEWPIEGNQETTPCKIVFENPLRILRNKQLIQEPTLADIIVAIHRRISALIPFSESWLSHLPVYLDLAKNTPCIPWIGNRLDFVRWSSTQQAEVEMRGVSGELVLPEGPGALWPLLAAAQWTHLGKGTIMGLGHLAIETI